MPVATTCKHLKKPTIQHEQSQMVYGTVGRHLSHSGIDQVILSRLQWTEVVACEKWQIRGWYVQEILNGTANPTKYPPIILAFLLSLGPNMRNGRGNKKRSKLMLCGNTWRQYFEWWKKRPVAQHRDRFMHFLWIYSRSNWLECPLYPKPPMCTSKLLRIRPSADLVPRIWPPTEVLQMQPVKGKEDVCPTIINIVAHSIFV